MQRLGVRLRYLPSCELGPPRVLRLTASGNFDVRSFDLSRQREVSNIDALPADTRYLSVVGEYGNLRAGGLLQVPQGDLDRDLLMLPLGKPCPLGDPSATARPGAVVAALGDGSLLMAGGLDPRGEAVAAFAVLRPGRSLTERGEMLLRRSFATATPVSGGLLVVGGAQGDRGQAHDTFERYDEGLGAFDAARGARLSAGPRRDHAAVALADGELLVLGGRAGADGAPLARAERIDPERDTARMSGELRRPRTSPAAFKMADGTVLVIGGFDGEGAAVVQLERFLPERDFFAGVQATIPEYTRYAATSLPGDRIGLLTCAADGSCLVSLLVPDPDGLQVLPLVLDYAGVGFAALERLRLADLGDGRLMVTGRDLSSGDRRAFVIDPTLASIRTAEVSRAALGLARLGDGNLVELDEFGAALLRLDVSTPFDTVPAGLLEARTRGLTLDAPQRWDFQPGGLQARVDNARFDLPRWRFFDVLVGLNLKGEASLKLQDVQGQSLTVTFGDSQVTGGECRVTRGEGTVNVSRAGDQLVVEAEGWRSECPLGDLEGPIALSLIAAEDTVVTQFSVRRL